MTIEKIEMNGGDEKGVIKAIPALKEAITETVSGDIAQCGTILRTIRTYS